MCALVCLLTGNSHSLFVTCIFVSLSFVRWRQSDSVWMCLYQLHPAIFTNLFLLCYATYVILCKFQLVYYASNISGVLKFGKINSLDGIETKQLFVWLPVTGIYVDDPASPYIYFQVGVLTKRLAVAIFESAPKCTSHAVKDRVESFSEVIIFLKSASITFSHKEFLWFISTSIVPT